MPLNEKANKLVNAMIEMYTVGNKSIPDISKKIGICKSTIRYRLLLNGVKLRSAHEGLVNSRHKLGTHLLGKKRTFSEQHKKNISEAKKRSNSLGVSLKPSGYIAITKGNEVNKNAHIVIMEAFLDRKLRDGEVVHHIDGDKTNNQIDNLALMTNIAHGRLHRYMDKISGKIIKRNKRGQICQ